MRELREKFQKPIGLLSVAALLLAGTTGCRQLPGSDETQGAVIGGVGGAAAGAAIGGPDNRVLGAILGAALGAGGGYIIGANSDRILGRDRDAAERASRRAETAPATVQDARTATTADLNNDGFVTMDEVVALERAGHTDQQILDKLQQTGQVFELTAEQENYLRNNGVSAQVVRQMDDLNREVRDRLSPTGRDSSIISRP